MTRRQRRPAKTIPHQTLLYTGISSVLKPEMLWDHRLSRPARPEPGRAHGCASHGGGPTGKEVLSHGKDSEQ